MKICIISICYECKYCSFDSEYSFDNEGYCLHEQVDDDKCKIKNVCGKIPKWCPLGDVGKGEK